MYVSHNNELTLEFCWYDSKMSDVMEVQKYVFIGKDGKMKMSLASLLDRWDICNKKLG